MFLFAYCTNPPITGKDVVGAREFVIDSYKIKEGKLSILELEGKEIDTLDAALFVEEKDLIVNGDVLEVSLYHPSRKDIAPYIQEVSNKIGYKVEDGFLCLPDLSPMDVSGLTIEEARKKIQQSYQKQIPDVEVFVFYKKRMEKNVEIIGMVKNNQVGVNARSRLFDVLSKAAVSSSVNWFKSYVVRDQKTLPIDLYKLVCEGDMGQNVVMKNGDKIFVADMESAAVMVIGEVAKQGIVSLHSNSISLQEALAKSGGILFTGNKAYIQVIRGNLVKPKIYTLNWRHIIRLPSDSLLLMPGDIVYVAANPISEWNRFINQLLPSFTMYELFAKGIKGVIIQDGAIN
ncbi:MAG: polysaccharide biosynthesis/export family protein [Chlamydiales bacterium]|nr:polysaccharide biosynthesis/export family protein [Chlamydiales bacterium]